MWVCYFSYSDCIYTYMYIYIYIIILVKVFTNYLDLVRGFERYE